MMLLWNHCLFIVVAMTGIVNISAEEDRSKWIDPHDMLNLGRSLEDYEREAAAKRMKTEDIGHEDSLEEPNQEGTMPVCKAVVKEVEKECPECEVCADLAAYPLLKQYIRVLLDHIKDRKPILSKEDYLIDITLTPGNVLIMEKFVSSKNIQHVHDVHDILHGMINGVVQSRLSPLEKWAQKFEKTLGIPLDRLVQFVALVALAWIILVIELKLQIPWRRRFSQLLMVMFLISIPWTWFHLYKQAEIESHSITNKVKPSECSEQDSWLHSLKSLLTLQEDKCLQYYEHLLVDPMLRVPPTKAIAVTIVRFIVAPLKDVGLAISEFLRALLIDLPLPLYPVAMVFVVILIFMFLMMWFGYNVRVPWLLSIERPPQVTIQDTGLQQAITNSTQPILNQFTQLKDRLQATESQLTDKLNHLEKMHQAAIEYTMSSALPLPAPSPSLSASVAASYQGVKVKVTDENDSSLSSNQLDTSSGVESSQEVTSVGAQGTS